jgi:hypothetical protein
MFDACSTQPKKTSSDLQGHMSLCGKEDWVKVSETYALSAGAFVDYFGIPLVWFLMEGAFI